MRKRIASIMDTRKKRAGGIIFALALIATICTSVVFAATNGTVLEEESYNFAATGGTLFVAESRDVILETRVVGEATIQADRDFILYRDMASFIFPENCTRPDCSNGKLGPVATTSNAHLLVALPPLFVGFS